MGSLSTGLIAGIAALLFGLLLTRNVMRQDQGNETMQNIAKAIATG